MPQKEITIDDPARLIELSGNLESNLKILEKEFSVEITARGDKLLLNGEDDAVGSAARCVATMQKLLGYSEYLDEQSVMYCVNLVKDGSEGEIVGLFGAQILITPKGKPVKPKTLGQKRYVEAMKDNTVVIGVGPAGTGKTYLAVAMAVRALKAHEVGRIILTRPAVEAGEKLGFLPGDLQNKVDPYLRPLYDALFDTLGVDSYQKLVEKGIIEIAPLAYMRGRTLDNAFIILDEAQNTTVEQMKMFLTRLGSGSKMVVNGDITQIDLPDRRRSGLVDAMRVLKNVEDISTVKFSDKDVVRSRLVGEIIKAYDRAAAPVNRRQNTNVK